VGDRGKAVGTEAVPFAELSPMSPDGVRAVDKNTVKVEQQALHV
jgi:hypothetical protein